MMYLRYFTPTSFAAALLLLALTGCSDESLIVGGEAPLHRLGAAAPQATADNGGFATADVGFRDGALTGKITVEVHVGAEGTEQAANSRFYYEDAEGQWFEAEVRQVHHFGGRRAAFSGPVRAGSVQAFVATWLYADVQDGGSSAADVLRYRFAPPGADFESFDEEGWTTPTIVTGELLVGGGEGGSALASSADCLSCQGETPGDEGGEATEPKPTDTEPKPTGEGGR